MLSTITKSQKLREKQGPLTDSVTSGVQTLASRKGDFWLYVS